MSVVNVPEIYSSPIIDAGYIGDLVNNGEFMIRVLKTLRLTPVVYLSYGIDETDFDKIISSARIIEFYVLSKFIDLYSSTYRKVGKIENRELINIFKAIGQHKDTSYYKNKNYLLKKLTILFAEKIYMLQKM